MAYLINDQTIWVRWGDEGPGIWVGWRDPTERLVFSEKYGPWYARALRIGHLKVKVLRSVR